MAKNKDKTYRARRALHIRGVGLVANGATVTLTDEQYRADRNSLVEVKGDEPAPEAGPPSANKNRMDSDLVTR